MHFLSSNVTLYVNGIFVFFFLHLTIDQMVNARGLLHTKGEEDFTVKFISGRRSIEKIYREKILLIDDNLPVMIGGSTTLLGPKNEGTSLWVVTGVFKSPVCECWTPPRSADCCTDSWIFNVGWCAWWWWWCPLDVDVVVVADCDDETVSVFEWVTEVAECELVLLLMLLFDVVLLLGWLTWVVGWCICCWWWLLSNCVWWWLFDVVWLLLRLKELAVVAAVLNKLQVSKLSTLKCAAAADSVNK